jgi:hypothetical protein
MSTKKNSQKKWLGNGKLLNKTFFVFGSTSRIFVSAKYSAENVFGRSLTAVQIATAAITRCALFIAFCSIIFLDNGAENPGFMTPNCF